MPDYMPIRDAEFNVWLQNFAMKLPAIATAVGLPTSFVTAVTTARGLWTLSYQAHIDLQATCQAGTETKTDAKVNVKEAVRAAVNILQELPATTDTQRHQLDITVRDTTPTSTSPEYVMEIDPPNLILDLKSGQVTIHFGVNPGDERDNAKPDGIGGAKIWYRVGEGQWQWAGDDTNSPYRHNIDLTTCGALEYRAQWFDKKMRTGLFSMVAQATVS